MAQIDYFIEFRENPQIGDSFSYLLRDEFGSVIPYENNEVLMVMNFGSGNIMPNQSAVLGTLSETLTNLVSQLNMGWNANFTNALGRNTQVSYAVVGSSVRVRLTVDFITGHKLMNVFMSSRFFMRTSTPCETFVYQTNRPIYGSSDFLSNAGISSLYGRVAFAVQDLTLNTTFANFTSFYSHVFRRGNLNRATFTNMPTQQFMRAFASQNFEPFFNENTLFIPFSADALTPNNAFEFSLNGTDWQSLNQFNDLEEGNYTVRIRDLFGCEKVYEIQNTGQSNLPTVEPNIYISESNSLRFVKNDGSLQNVYNSFSFLETDINPFTHIFKSDETIQTEIRASYQDLQANYGTIEKIVANIGITDSRDALFFNQNESLVCSFESGNIYVDGVEVDTYELNGNLPEWGVIGNWCITNYGLLQIIDIQILENGAKYLIFNSNEILIEPTTSIISCIYNREIYDIFVHTMDMNEFENECFYIEIFNDENIFYRSETIQVLSEMPSMFRLMTWSNSKNTDIYYASGIEMRAWLPISRLVEMPDGEVEALRTDAQVYTVRNLNYKGVQLTIDNLTRGMARKINLALKHDTLIVNDIQYTLAESPEMENYGTSYFYRISAKLIEKGDAFNTLGVTSPFTGDVLRLLESGNENYIKIN